MIHTPTRMQGRPSRQPRRSHWIRGTRVAQGRRLRRRSRRSIRRRRIATQTQAAPPMTVHPQRRRIPKRSRRRRPGLSRCPKQAGTSMRRMLRRRQRNKKTWWTCWEETPSARPSPTPCPVDLHSFNHHRPNNSRSHKALICSHNWPWMPHRPAIAVAIILTWTVYSEIPNKHNLPNNNNRTILDLCPGSPLDNSSSNNNNLHSITMHLDSKTRVPSLRLNNLPNNRITCFPLWQWEAPNNPISNSMPLDQVSPKHSSSSSSTLHNKPSRAPSTYSSSKTLIRSSHNNSNSL